MENYICYTGSWQTIYKNAAIAKKKEKKKGKESVE